VIAACLGTGFIWEKNFVLPVYLWTCRNTVFRSTRKLMVAIYTKRV
jgi:hypothetical protein